MFDRYNNESFRKTLFGTAGRRNAPPVLPVMEQVSPQTAGERSGAENAARPCLEACSLAMVYSPAQEWRGLYPVGEAIRKGTLFTELDKPFLGKTLSGR